MLLPFHRRPTSLKPLPKIRASISVESPLDPVRCSLQHLDYNHRPLRVESLSHYIEPVVDDERFRVH